MIAYLHRLLITVVCGLAAVSTFVSAEPVVREVHKDWTVVCDTPEQVGQEICLIVQQKNIKDSNQPILRVEVGYAVSNGEPFTIITAPLGIALQAGLTVQIDDNEPTVMQFGSCIPTGCVVGSNLSEHQVNALKFGNEAKFTLQDSRRRNVTVPVSLAGFTAALNAISPN